ncbi:enhanced serine sensitivity protein SseB C-terminal domain-containing protein [Janthinobacterium sp.]|uniref:enhanced serine sensitivity protein SseB C-terminal domain-containing protein n=1 Tax=Janthinobacterium sp. TaxID=1871054 RepID=UPI00293D2A78|nr:enhanced serine sensitivity protein SseB C-terminal domain-containing protein [Janthinobacterium sp.]
MPIAESDLERLLRLAARDAARRPEFYRALLAADVYVVGATELVQSGRAGVGERIAIEHWTRADGAVIIPFFSSLAALQRAIDAECDYLQLSARALFEITRGAALALNPKSPYSRAFPPAEVAAMLGGDGNAPGAATQVFLGQPRHYPALLVDALTTLLAGRGNVHAAYLSLMLAPSVDSRPHLLVAIHADGDTGQLMRDAGRVACGAAPAGKAVDLTLLVAGEDPLSDYFLHSVAPFYERSWGARLHAAPGVGHA